MSFKFHIAAAFALGGLAGGASLLAAGPAAAQAMGLTAAPTEPTSSSPSSSSASAPAAAEAPTSSSMSLPAPAASPAAVPAAETPATPLQAAILRAAANDAEALAWYQARDGRPAWDVTGGAMDAQALLARLDAAESHALPAAA